MTNLVDLQCTSCNKKFDANHVQTLCTCGKVLFANYDIEKTKETLTKDLQNRSHNIWRMHEIMPCNSRYQYSLGEGYTPIINLNDDFNITLKHEGYNPTGTFKSRGLCAAVSKSVELGITDFVIPTAGNAGAALAAYCAYTKTNAHVFMPSDTPQTIKSEVHAFGAELVLVDGLISDAGKIAKQNSITFGWHDVSTLKEPYRVEGKKTMGLEIAEQLNWEVPDVIIYPTGGGTGIIGIHKAFNELEKIGFIDSKRPRMVAVQSSTCAPIVDAFNNKQEEAIPWENASTIAPGLRVPVAIGDYLILKTIYQTSGTAISVPDEEIIYAMKQLAKTNGIALAPEAAATYAAVKHLKNDGWLDRDEITLLLATGSGLTTPELWNY
ncbi:MAG: Threonine synthase [Candidatus Heimdallarchaeota archaeon LC_2]|nr:MAG: Threonine synthase [Candidatus Heimdallarchaeota archaeon LC_2]